MKFLADASQVTKIVQSMIAIRATRYDPSQCGIFLLNAAVELGKKIGRCKSH
jgi:hypothetical protein